MTLWQIFAQEDAPGDLAYDGSDEPQERPLTARERDILCRVLSDILGEIRRTGSTDAVPIRIGSQQDVAHFIRIRSVLSPREQCRCRVGVQYCPMHPDALWSKEEKIAFRKKWDERVVESQRRNDDKEDQ